VKRHPREDRVLADHRCLQSPALKGVEQNGCRYFAHNDAIRPTNLRTAASLGVMSDSLHLAAFTGMMWRYSAKPPVRHACRC
jgi:hypothetical protein